MAKRTMKTAFRSPNTAVDPQRSAALKGNKNAKKKSATIPAFITGLIHDPKHNDRAIKAYSKYGSAAVKSYKIAAKIRKIVRSGR